jgi:hypothetical protein
MPTLDERRQLGELLTKRLASEMKATGLLDFLKENGWGVTIFAFEFNEPGDQGSFAYLSTAQRPDMIKALKEFLAYQEAGLATEPRGDRPQG